MKKIASFQKVLMHSFLFLLGGIFFFSFSSNAFACLTATKNTTTQGKDTTHYYYVTNTCSVAYTYTVDFGYSTEGDTVVTSVTQPPDHYLQPGQQDYYEVKAHTDQCHTGKLRSHLTATVTGQCGQDSDSECAVTTFEASCQKYWCTSSNQCTSGSSCPSGKTCYDSNSSCVSHATTDCPKNCDDTNGDGYADRCVDNGNLPQHCSSLADCPSPPVKRCHDTNGDGYADQCIVNGNLSQTCNTVADCPSPPVKRCHDTNGDGYADQCINNGNLPQTCNTVADCPQEPIYYWCTTTSQCTNGSLSQCMASGNPCYTTGGSCLANAPVDCAVIETHCHDNNGDGYADACIINGNMTETCVTVLDCPIAPIRCHDTNGDGYAEACIVHGNMTITCDSIADCPLLPEQRCHDNNGDGYADACQINGNMPQVCATLSDCPVPPYPRCYDSNNDGVYDQCSSQGDGIYCTVVDDCLLQRGCNEDDQCVYGGTLGVCTSDLDCQPPPETYYWCLLNSGETTCPHSGQYGSEQECENTTGADCFSSQSQCNVGATERCAIGEQTFYWCTSTSQCTFGQYPDANTCRLDNRHPCYDDNNTCLGHASSDCGGGGGTSCNTSCYVVGEPCGDGTTCMMLNGSLVCRNGPDDNDQWPGNCPNDTDCVCGGGGGTSCNTSCTTEGTRCGDGTTCMMVNGSLLCRNGPDDNDQWPGNCPSDTDCDCGGGGGTSCNTSCTVEGSFCNDATTCMMINGSLTCRNRSCPSETDCTCGGGGLFRCYDPNGGTNYIACNELGQGPLCANVDQCRGGGGTFCGDGVVQRPNSHGQMEECDDGNTVDDGNGCTADCRLKAPANRCIDTNNDGIYDVCQPAESGKLCNKIEDCLGCYDCSCIEKTSDPAIVGDNQNVRYQIVIENRTYTTNPWQYTPYAIRVTDTIFQKKKFINNNPLPPEGGVEDFMSTQGYIEYPYSIHVDYKSPNIVVRGIDGISSDARDGFIVFTPGYGIGDPSNPGSGSAPIFTIENLSPGTRVVLSYVGKAQTDYPTHAFEPTTQFIDITNEVRTQTNNDYASVTVSKPYLMTTSIGNMYIQGTNANSNTSLLNTVNVSNLAPLFGLDANLYKNIAGLLISPNSLLNTLSSYIGMIDHYLGFDLDILYQQIERTEQQVIKNYIPAVFTPSTITSENDLELLGRRPDNARVYIADATLTIDLGDTKISNMETVVVTHGDLVITSNIEYGQPAGDVALPSIAFVVLDGDIKIASTVTHLDGVYVVKREGAKITGDGQQSIVQLIIQGAVFGDMGPLLSQRTFVGLPDQQGASVIVQYDARIMTHTPPGLRDILGSMLFQQVAK